MVKVPRIRYCPLCHGIAIPVYRAMCPVCFKRCPDNLRFALMSAFRLRALEPARYFDALIAAREWHDSTPIHAAEQPDEL